MRRWQRLDLRPWALFGAVLALIYAFTMPSGHTAGRPTARDHDMQWALYRNWLVGSLTDNPAALGPARPSTPSGPPGAAAPGPAAPGPAAPGPALPSTPSGSAHPRAEEAPASSRRWPLSLVLLGSALVTAAAATIAALHRRRRLTP